MIYMLHYTTRCSGITGEVQCVGWWALLQPISWTHGSTYKISCTLYTEYVTRKYEEAVVFDGHDGTSTKDMAHYRLAEGCAGATVTFDEDMLVTVKEDQFLASKMNK